jgi:hypothetical protein
MQLRCIHLWAGSFVFRYSIFLSARRSFTFVASSLLTTPTVVPKSCPMHKSTERRRMFFLFTFRNPPPPPQHPPPPPLPPPRNRPYTAAHGQTKAIYLLFVEEYTKAVRQHENDGSIDGPSIPTVKSQIKTLYDIWRKQQQLLLPQEVMSLTPRLTS